MPRSLFVTVRYCACRRDRRRHRRMSHRCRAAAWLLPLPAEPRLRPMVEADPPPLLPFRAGRRASRPKSCAALSWPADAPPTPRWTPSRRLLAAACRRPARASAALVPSRPPALAPPTPRSTPSHRLLAAAGATTRPCRARTVPPAARAGAADTQCRRRPAVLARRRRTTRPCRAPHCSVSAARAGAATPVSTPIPPPRHRRRTTPVPSPHWFAGRPRWRRRHPTWAEPRPARARGRTPVPSTALVPPRPALATPKPNVEPTPRRRRYPRGSAGPDRDAGLAAARRGAANPRVEAEPPPKPPADEPPVPSTVPTEPDPARRSPGPIVELVCACAIMRWSRGRSPPTLRSELP
jgi:hypothetical protein